MAEPKYGSTVAVACLASSFVAVSVQGALAGLGMAVNLWLGLYSAPGEWPWTYFFLVVIQLLFLVDPPGRSLGVDVLLQQSVMRISPRGVAVVRAIG